MLYKSKEKRPSSVVVTKVSIMLVVIPTPITVEMNILMVASTP